MLSHTHKILIEENIFKAYGYLGYSKEFTSKAHRILEMNIENEKELENAAILKRLGDFYESKGSNGT